LEVIHHGNINGKDVAYYSLEATQKKYGSRDDFRKSIGIEDDEFAFVFVGRIVGDKGMNELATAMKNLSPRYPKIKLVLVGPYEKELDPISPEAESFFLTDASTIMAGNQDDVRPYLMAANALVFPSYREGFPNVVLEAGLLGLPSIVTDISGCNEIIVEGENGVIVPPKDAEQLQIAMEKFLSKPDLLAALATNARSMIVSRFKQEDIWAALLKMYQEEIQKKK
jgi:glycosyltransferase involved in cell wall biosynthesis